MNFFLVSFWSFVIGGIVFSTLLAIRGDSERQRLLVRRWKRQYPETDVEYDRFNTREERSTTATLGSDDLLRLATDLQRVAVEEGSLVLDVASQLELYALHLRLDCAPFSLEMLTGDGPADERELRRLTVTGQGVHTGVLATYPGELLGTEFSMDLAARQVELRVLRVRPAAGSGRLELYGLLPDDAESDLSVDVNAYRLEASFPAASLRSLARV